MVTRAIVRPVVRSILRPIVGGVSASLLGPELLANGGFDSDTVWTKGAGWVIAAGVATFVGLGSSALLSQPVAFITGRTYAVTINVTSVSGGSILLRGYLGAGLVFAFSPSITAPGLYGRTAVVAGTSDTFSIAAGAVVNATIDSVSLRMLLT